MTEQTTADKFVKWFDGLENEETLIKILKFLVGDKSILKELFSEDVAGGLHGYIGEIDIIDYPIIGSFYYKEEKEDGSSVEKKCRCRPIRFIDDSKIHFFDAPNAKDVFVDKTEDDLRSRIRKQAAAESTTPNALIERLFDAHLKSLNE